MVDCPSDHGGIDQVFVPQGQGKKDDTRALIDANVYSDITQSVLAYTTILSAQVS